MIDLRISSFQSSEKCSVDLENFEPVGGLELFIKSYSEYIGEEVLKWNRSWEFGVGCMTFSGNEIALIQSEFPHVLSFDCRNKILANELRKSLESFFKSHIGKNFLTGSDPKKSAGEVISKRDYR